MKFFGRSKGFWGIAIAGVAWGVDKLTGVGILPPGLPEAALTIAQAAGGLLALYGRWRAKEPLGLRR